MQTLLYCWILIRKSLSLVPHCTQVGYMDEVVGNITNEIKARGMWARTLLVRRETLSNVPFHCCFLQIFRGRRATSTCS